ncbi:MAG TPA: vWA domain-containing protein, partial [Rectinemataceae bacterium]|nr:vWA domain-containing protein [Rectinemataceae bacterium]
SPPKRGASPARRPDLSRYMGATVTAFEAIAAGASGEARFAENENDIVTQLSAILDRAAGQTTELVICMDTTESMLNDIEAMRKKAPAMLRSRLKDFPSLRLGIVLYRDYFEEYLTKRLDFTSELGVFEEELKAIRVTGGRDIPEAVYEALNSALVEFPWSAQRRLVVLIGDAPPHPIPRGSVDAATVQEAASRLGVEMDVIILPE